MLIRLQIEVRPAKEAVRFRRLFDALERLFPVTIQPAPANDPETFSEAALLLGIDRTAALQIARRGIACYAAMGSEATLSPLDSKTATSAPVTVHFHKNIPSEPLLNDNTLIEFGDSGAGELVVGSGDSPVADREGKLFWTRHDCGSGSVDFVATTLPALGPHDYLCHFFSGESFCRLLPLICFLRRLCSKRLGWTPPPKRGCFVFDDPNLRAFRYGCLDFRQLASTTQQQGLHAAIATIPIDADEADRKVCGLFRERARHISLMPHGNNHVWHELARPEKDGLQIQLMAQALRRVERLTAQHGVTVSRIMEPPYGIVNREFIQALASLDYAGVLVTPSQFLKVNTSYDGPASFGMERAETFTNGLGMIPRIVMGNKAPTEMVLAALLDQPIVVAAHHYDVADGMSWLSSYAARLQTGGPIQWCDLSTLLEGSYETLAENDRLRIRTGARTIKVTIPDNIHAIIVERPWIHSLVREPLCIRTTSDEIVAKVTVGDVSDPIPIPAGTTLRIETTPSNIQPADRITDPGVALWPKVRRTLMEARDRLYPWALKYLEPLLPGNDF